VATSPFVTLPLLIASLYGLCFTPLFTDLMRTWWGHDLMLGHFLPVGLLFYFPLLGVDPAPRKPHPVVGMLELMAGHRADHPVLRAPACLLGRGGDERPVHRRGHRLGVWRSPP
jgi:cytochrome c oxidase assembly factor CtaG